MKSVTNALIVLVCCAHSLAGHISNYSKTPCPKIVGREDWDARNATKNITSTHSVPFVVIHHAASTSCYTQTECSNLCRQFQNLHMDSRRWSDIGYNFLIGGNGEIYEGRGWGKVGAHAAGANKKSVGVCFIGTFIDNLPNKLAIQAAAELISCGVSAGKISSTYKLIGHRQVTDTECPGEALYKLIQTWPQWTSAHNND